MSYLNGLATGIVGTLLIIGVVEYFFGNGSPLLGRVTRWREAVATTVEQRTLNGLGLFFIVCQIATTLFVALLLSELAIKRDLILVIGWLTASLTFGLLLALFGTRTATAIYGYDGKEQFLRIYSHSSNPSEVQNRLRGRCLMSQGIADIFNLSTPSCVATAIIVICCLNTPAVSARELLNIQKSSNSNDVIVLNVGSEPVMVLGVTINDAINCRTGTAFVERLDTIHDGLTFVPRELKAGNQLLVYNRLGTSRHEGCRLIRAELVTDQGSETFTFLP
jgi:hypothetical protein